MALTKEDLQAIGSLMDDMREELKQGQAATNARLDKLTTKVDKLEQGQAKLETEMHKRFKETSDIIVDAVELVGQKTDQIDRAIRDMQGATAQNAYELQILKSRA